MFKIAKKKRKRFSDLGVQGNSPKNVNTGILPPPPSPTFCVAVKPRGRVVAGVYPQGGWVCRFEIYATPLFWRKFLKASWAVDIKRRRAEAALHKGTSSLTGGIMWEVHFRPSFFLPKIHSFTKSIRTTMPRTSGKTLYPKKVEIYWGVVLGVIRNTGRCNPSQITKKSMLKNSSKNST